MMPSGLRTWILVMVGAWLGVAAGCSGDKVAYRGPYIDAEPVGGAYQLTCYAPSAGWGFEVDREVFIPATLREVYVTVRRPDPNQMHAQMIVEHVARTDLNTLGPLFVYARVVDAAQPVTKTDPEHVQVQMFRP
jgi:hypothetical protein